LAVRLLLDTHVLIWWLLADSRLPKTLTELLMDRRTRVLVSAASALEVTTKYRLGRLPKAAELALDFTRIVTDEGMELLPISAEHAARAGLFEVPHRDPFDRVLAAQSLTEALPLATRDQAFEAFEIPTIWGGPTASSLDDA
jgi:PIN domain nuclease of toxin-antitoxin system